MRMDSPAPPTHSLLAGIDWASVSRSAARELLNREKYAPAVSTFRWWARRSHHVMGTLLDAASDRYGRALTVSDPFSGGGTVAFEAARRGIRTYAQDLYPWPAFGLATALAPVSSVEFEAASEHLLQGLSRIRSAYQRPDGRTLSHILRVRAVSCASCSTHFYAPPDPLISIATRSLGERRVYLCCAGCGTVSARVSGCARFRCGVCDLEQSATHGPSSCPHCGHASAEAPPALTKEWKALLVSEIYRDRGRERTLLRLAERDDPVDDVKSRAPAPIREAIPAGIETNRLMSAGFSRWCDLYSGRQIRFLSAALCKVRELDASPQVKDHLALCILGLAETPAFITRWDRFNLKPFEALANHRYSCGAVAVECNPMSPVGRGTLQRRLRAALKSIEWLNQSSSRRRVAVRDTSTRGRRPSNWDVLVATGSSEAQLLPDRSVSLVLTDPPYHDDVQYGELARLFHGWLRVHRPEVLVREALEASPNRHRGRDSRGYVATIANCLSESARTLRPNGRLLMTFHNRDLAAWLGLAEALHSSGFAVSALAAVRAESGNDHCKRNVDAMLHDLVLECVPTRIAAPRARLAFTPRSASEKNLAAVGLAVAATSRSGSFEDFERVFARCLRALRSRKRLID